MASSNGGYCNVSSQRDKALTGMVETMDYIIITVC